MRQMKFLPNVQVLDRFKITRAFCKSSYVKKKTVDVQLSASRVAAGGSFFLDVNGKSTAIIIGTKRPCMVVGSSR